MRSWVLKYINQFRISFSWSLIFGLIGITSGALLLFISGYLITRSSLQPENIMAVYVPIVSVRAFSISRAVFLYLEQLISHEFVLTILEKMRRRLYDSLEKQVLFIESTYQTGDILGVLSEDIERLQDLYLRTIFPAAIGTIIYLLLSIVLGFFNIPFALLTLAVLGVVVFLIPYISYKRLETNFKVDKEKTHFLYQQITNLLFGRIDWLASGQVENIYNETKKANESLFLTEAKRDRFKRLRNFIIQLITGLFVVFMMYWAIRMNDENIIQPTFIAAFVLMTLSLVDVLEPVSESFERIPQDLDALNRIQNVTKEKEINKKETFHLEEVVYEPDEYTICIDRVSFRYQNNQENVLNDINLTIEEGEKICILGRSGSGKSTLLQLISGLQQPKQGTITIGNQIAHKQMLGKTIGILNQKPHLFNTTIRNNLTLANENITEEKLNEAIEKVQLKQLIEKLPNGLDTEMEEMGQRFSGGERQRIAFARILLQETPIVILDEPTIGLDFYTEEKLLEMILQALNDRTVILITHHLALVEKFDKLIFLQNGKINLQGTHKHLLKTSSYYQKLIQLEQ